MAPSRATPAPGEHDRMLRVREDVGRPVHLVARRAKGRRGTFTAQRLALGAALRHILGQIRNVGARAARSAPA